MDEKNYRKYFWILLITTTILRIFIASFLGLGVDEAHYFQYAMHPSLSYYDHPPLTGYFIRIFIELFGKHTFSVRLPSIISSILTMILIFKIGSLLYSEKSGFWAVVLFNLIPIFSGIGSIMIVPDSILSPLSLTLIYLVLKIKRTGKGYLWYLCGIIMGLILLTKYTGFLLYLSLLLFILILPDMRKWLKKKELWLGFLISVVIFLPVIIWNYIWNWISFSFQLHHGFGKKVLFDYKVFLKNIGAQAGSFSPFIFIFLLIVFFKILLGTIRKDESSTVIFSFVFPVFFIFFLASLSNEILPHWPAIGYLFILIPAGEFIEKILKTKKYVFKFLLIFAMVCGGGMSIIIPLHAIFKILPIPSEYDPTNDILGWEKIAEKIMEIKENEFFIFTHKFYLASQISFYLPEDVEIYCLSKRIDQYDIWQYNRNLEEKLKWRNGIFFTDSHFKVNPADLYVFRRIEKLQPLKVFYRGKNVKTFYIYRCYGFDTEKTEKKILNSIPFSPKNFKKEVLEWNEKTFLKINGLARKNKFLDSFFYICGYLGSGYVLVPVVSLFIYFRRRKGFWKYLGIFMLILIIGGNIVYIIKEKTKIPRPAVHFKEKKINIIGPKLKSCSFPSGHSQTVFTGVFFLTWFFPKYWYIYWIFGIISGISRCYVGAHFPLDVIGGFSIAGISFFIVYLCLIRKIKK